MDIIKPKKLNKGDLIGIVAPSAPITKEIEVLFYKGIEFLEKDFGLRVTYKKNIFDKHFYNAGTKERRLNEFHEIWANSDVKMVLMAQGGYTSNQLLDGINYDLIKNNPKIFAGISDGTTLLNAIHKKTGLITYHGPDLMFTFGRSLTNNVKENIYKTFFEGDVKFLKENERWNNKVNKNFKKATWNTLKSGLSTGQLIGGHLGTLINLIASGNIDSFENKILFLEGTGTDYEVDSCLTTLKLAGVFDKITGLILGWFEDFSKQETESRKISDIVLDTTIDYNFPILEIGDLGHNVENYVFPIGLDVELDADNKIVRFNEETVK